MERWWSPGRMSLEGLFQRHLHLFPDLRKWLNQRKRRRRECAFLPKALNPGMIGVLKICGHFLEFSFIFIAPKKLQNHMGLRFIIIYIVYHYLSMPLGKGTIYQFWWILILFPQILGVLGLPDVSLENQHQTQPMPRTSLAASLGVSPARLLVEDKTRVAKDHCVTLTLRQLDM